MSRDRLESAISRLARRPVETGPGHREALDREIAARHGAATKERTMTVALRRTAIAAGLLAAVGAGASQVPARYDAEVGKRIEIRSASPVPREAVEAAVRAIEAGAADLDSRAADLPGRTEAVRREATAPEARRRQLEVRVQAHSVPGGGSTIRIDARGDTIGLDGIPEAIRQAAPALAAAEIRVQPIEETVDGDLGALVANRLLEQGLTPEQLKATLERRLAEEGLPGEVEVQVEGDAGGERREVRVRVVKEAPAPPDGGAR